MPKVIYDYNGKCRQHSANNSAIRVTTVRISIPTLSFIHLVIHLPIKQIGQGLL